MIPPSPLSRPVGALRALAVVGLALAVTTCRDALGPRGGVGGGLGRLAVAPVLPSNVALADFGLVIDQVRILVVRPPTPPDTLVDTTVALPPAATGLDLDLHVPLLTSPETLEVTIIALAGTTPLFSGTSPVAVTSDEGTPEPTVIPTTYVGPGAGVDSLVIVPQAPFLYLNDSLRLQVQAFQGGVPVTQFYVAWSTSDTAVAEINNFGVLRAPATRGAVQVRARTPGGVADSVTAEFVPLPTQLVKIAGDGQTAAAGQALATPLEVEVRGGDNLPVGGVGVRFQTAGGGAPVDTTITTGVNGRAQLTGVLGSGVGAQTFQVTVPAFAGIPSVSFSATATAAAPKTIAIVSGNAQTDTVNKVLAAPFVVVVRDTFSNVVSGARVAWSVVLGGGTPGTDTTTTLANGQTSVTYQLGAVPGIDTVRAALVGTSATATFVATAIAPTPARVAFTVEPSSATSGSAIVPAIQVTVLDGSGNPIPTATNGITLALGANPGGDTLSGTTTVSAVNGVATFSGLSLGKAASGYRLIASAAGLVPDTSVAFTITPGAPVALAFTVQPSAAAAGTAIAPAVQVAVTDAAGNLIPAATDSVTVAIGANPSGGVLSGTVTVGASAGVAPFADLRIDQPGTGYTLVATATGLAMDTSAAFDVAPPASVVFWTNASGGTWSNAANWSGGAVPALGDTAVINLSGTYTVTLDVADTVGGLKIGGGSGTQTLLVGSQPLGVGGALDVNAGAVLDVRNPGQLSGLGTLTNSGTVKLRGTTVAKPLANVGTLYVDGGTTLSGGLTTTATSLIRVQGNGATGFSQLSVGPFTNNGTITLTDTTAAYGARLNVGVGGLTNAAGAFIIADQGAGGSRQLNADFNNQGTITAAAAPGQTFTLATVDVTGGHVNGGAIVVSSGALAIVQGGTNSFFTSSGSIDASGGNLKVNQVSTGTFTLSGPLVVGAGDTLGINAGTFNYNSGGQLAGLGVVALQGGLIANFTPSFSNDTLALTLGNTTLNGPGTITNVVGRTFSMRSTTINAAFVNAGSLLVDGSSTLGGSLTTAATSSIRVQGNGATGFSRLTVASGFTNNGAIVLTDTTAAYGAGLDVAAGTLVNAAGATIDAALGAGGARQLNVQLNNQGSLTVGVAPGQVLTMARAAAVDTNGGTITVSSGALTISQSGASSFANSGTLDFSGGNFTINQSGGAFTTTGTVTVGAADTFKVSGGTFDYVSGSLGSSGTIALVGGVVANFTPSFSNNLQALVLTNATLNGPGTITNTVGHTLTLRSSTINAPFVNDGALHADGNSALGGGVTTATTSSIRIQGNGSTGFSRLTVASGFTNNGQIVLTDTTAAYGAGLDVTTGRLINAVGATIDAPAGAGGGRQLNAQFTNQGTISVNVAAGQLLSLAHAAAVDTNSGTIAVGSGGLQITQSGASSFIHTGALTLSGGGLTFAQGAGSFSSSGTITIGAGQTLAISGGTFDYAAGTIGGTGNLSLQGSVVAAFTPSFANDTLGLTLVNATLNGPGAVTNDTARFMTVRSSTINAPFTNYGGLFVDGTSAFGGPLATGPTSLIRVQGSGATGFSRLTVAAGFTNNGIIALTDTTATYGAGLDVTTGVLVNAAGATIRADSGALGGRQLNAELDNQGSLLVAVAPAQALTLSKAAASHRNAGTITLASGSLTVAGGSSSFTNDTAGTIEGLGILNVSAVGFSNLGSVRPGLGAAGILSITGNYPAAPTESLHIELGGTTPGIQYDRLAVSGSAAVGGALHVSLINGFTPALGDTFTVMTFASRSGAFGALNLPLLGGGLALDTMFTATSLRLTVIAPLLVHAADITADELWSAAGTHIVSSYVRILNGATLTIADGATVKFDSGAGLQVGDTTLGQAGGLVMSGTPGSIHLTANSATPAAGFWKGLEVQKTMAPLTWRHVDIEYAGGARSNPFNEACVLLVDPAAAVELDSVHIRQCVHAGVHHFAGSMHMHRSRIDSVTGSGIHAEYVTGAPVLRLDSTTIRGSGQEGLFIGNGFVNLVGATGNRFVGNAVAGVHIFGSQLSGFGLQDSIAGNGFGAGGFGDTIVVDSGTVGFGVPSFTIYRQSAPYLFTGSLNVWSSTGVNVTLDSGVVMTFDTTASMSVGDFADSAGNSSGVSANLVSLGTAASPVVLRNRQGRPGWGGLYLGAQAGTPVVRHLRLVGGGYQPTCSSCPPVLVRGFFEPLNANLWVDAPIGVAPLAIDSVVSDSSAFHGIVVKRGPPQGIRVRDNLIRQSAGTGLVSRAQQYNAADTISGNTITGNFYPLDLPADLLPGLGANSLAGNGRDTLLLHGGTLVVSDTLPQLGFRWRVTQPVAVDGGATLWVLAGDTVTFDPNATLTIGGTSPSALNAMGTAVAPIVFTAATPAYWAGLEFANLSAATAVSNVIVEKGGAFVSCPFDCLPTFLAAIRYRNVSANPLTLDAVTIRQSMLTALDVDSTAASPLTVQGSRFYENPFSPMIKAASPLMLAIHGSDLYHYNGRIIETAETGADSLDAIDNWWGDAAGLYAGVPGSDSLGRAALQSSAVRFNLLSGPLFPVGPAAQIVPATDTILENAAISSIVGDPDSIRVRVLDAQGRGMPGVLIGWGTSSGVFNDPGTPTDAGGRAAGVWLTDTVGNEQFVQATVAGLTGSPVTWVGFLPPGATLSANFELLPSLTAGTVDPVDSNTVTFTSSGRQGVFVTHTRDQYGNVTQPSGVPNFCFDDVPATGTCHNQFWFQPQYGIIDSVKADSVFFTLTTTSPALLQIHAQYDGGAITDSILIAVTPVAASMRISQDSAVFNAICPVVGSRDVSCQQPFTAQVVDSGGVPLPPNPARATFTWTAQPGDTTVTIDSVTGVASEQAWVTAHANGTTWVLADQTGGTAILVPTHDSLPIVVVQQAALVAITPDTVRARIGDTLVFNAVVTDASGSPMPGDTIHWQEVSAGTLAIIDTSVAGQVTVRLDSTTGAYTYLYGYTNSGPAGYAAIYNPVIATTPNVGTNPGGVAVNTATGKVYVALGTDSVAVIDAATDSVVARIAMPAPTYSMGVDESRNLIYAGSNFGSILYIIDGAADQVVDSMSVGQFFVPPFVVDGANNRIIAPTVICVGISACIDTDFLATFDATLGGAHAVLDTVRIVRQGLATAYDPATNRAYVGILGGPDSVKVVDLNTKAVVDSFQVGTASASIANLLFNPLTNRLYVTDYNDWYAYVWDIASKTLVNYHFSPTPEGMAIDTVSKRIYVTSYDSNQIVEVDATTDGYVQTLNVGSATSQVGVLRGGRKVFFNTYSAAGASDVKLLKY